MIDISKLGPAETWHPENWDVLTLAYFATDAGATDLAFIKLARQAFDVMMRRPSWYVQCLMLPDRRVYKVFGDGLDSIVCRNMPRIRDDPFTALVEADKWYVENVESN